MNIKKYGIVYILLALVIAVFLVTRLFPNAKIADFVTTESTPSAQVTNGITVDINFDESSTKTYQNIVAPNAYLALVEAAKQIGWEVETKQYDFGLMVQKVGPYENTSEKSWIYFVNGAAGETSADQKMIVSGDKVEWKYVIPE